MAERKHLRIAMRRSPLSYWQANLVKKQLAYHYPSLQIELISFLTEGDKQRVTSLSKLGGKGVFVKELEMALLNGQADIAVHSMKDVPMALEKGLTLASICQRDDPRDVLISKSGEGLFRLPADSTIGTSSLRRQSQLLALRSDLKLRMLRGNVGTRLDKLAAGEYDAIILAAAGLIRLSKTACISEYFSTNYFLPAPGQGALGIECLCNDEAVHALVFKINHRPTYTCVMAERALSRELGGNCQVPIAAHAEYVSTDQLRLQGLVAEPDGTRVIKAERYGNINEFEKLGIEVANELKAEGAREILKGLL